MGVNRRVRPTPKNGVAQPLLVTAPPREMLEEEEEEEDAGRTREMITWRGMIRKGEDEEVNEEEEEEEEKSRG